MSRRGQNEGSIFRRKDGRWCAAIGDGQHMQGRRRKYFYGKTQAEVREQLLNARSDLKQGLPVAPERQTVAQFFNRWLDESVKPSVRPLTYRSYDQIACLIAPELRKLRPRKFGSHGKPYRESKAISRGIGHIRLQKLDPQSVQELLNQRLKDGLSARTVQYILAVLRHALDQAAKWGNVARNVARQVDSPRVKRPEIEPLTLEQAKRFLEAARGERLEALYPTVLMLGLRRGEILGLRWEDIDFDARALRVAQALQRANGRLRTVEPKSDRSRRVLALPDSVVASLRAHRVRQLEERLAAGSDWKDTGLVFTSGTGKPLDPQNMSRDFKRLLRKAGLRMIRFHDLRHSAASLLLAQGAHPRAIMELLGHSQISLTMNTYSHVMPTMMRDLADKMDSLMAVGN